MPLLGKKVYRVTPGRAGIRYKKEEQSQAQPAAGAKEAKQENGANADNASSRNAGVLKTSTRLHERMKLQNLNEATRSCASAR